MRPVAGATAGVRVGPTVSGGAYWYGSGGKSQTPGEAVVWVPNSAVPPWGSRVEGRLAAAGVSEGFAAREGAVPQ